MSIVRIDPEGRRNAEHIAIIVVVDLVPIQARFVGIEARFVGIEREGLEARVPLQRLRHCYSSPVVYARVSA